ncbi:MAG: hypothetical protein J0H06_08520 [Actinobacteria bacterium]|nr:hypothetical protein [Actinomycetota bacterium]OJU86038.1 MAG: hypothetical protein BGO11_04155 [Solirubrobacterales bacterium 70-9]
MIRLRNITRLALMALVAAIAVSACGGGGAGTSTNDAVSESGSEAEIVEGAFWGGHDTDEVSVTGKKPVKPCSLVPKGKAEAILGADVQVSERLQGPTCVYLGSGREIDLVVEQNSVASRKSEADRVEPVGIDGRQAYCLTSRSTSVLASVGGGLVLQVTGPCQAGVRFASLALESL